MTWDTQYVPPNPAMQLGFIAGMRKALEIIERAMLTGGDTEQNSIQGARDAELGEMIQGGILDQLERIYNPTAFAESS